MFVTIYECRAKQGRVQEVVSLFEDWRCHLEEAKDQVSTELLRSRDDDAGFIAVARFANEDIAWTIMQKPTYRDWYGRLVSLSEYGPIVAQYHTLDTDQLRAC